ncbi:hypothetical protein ACFU99_41525 [Streptomyces sp. NPDC057654]|uniref:hypothetical protein n=1 Tax=Streptomyces sp. NPDC057654 TaxID=3346196 RepID=UPI00368562AD
MGHWWSRNIVEPGKLPLLLALASFVLTFLVTRVITRLIRAGKGPFRNIRPGGLHIHHVVPGIVLMVVGGFGAVAGGRQGFGTSVTAVLFGAGAGLVLDEFALVLHLDDVYWSEQGRKSVEVVVLTAALVALMLAGFSPFGVDALTPEELRSRGLVTTNVALNFAISLFALAKGKPRIAVIGVVVPFVAIIGAVRLARPGSPWARRCYRRRPRARRKARVRAYRHDARWQALRRRFQDLVAGAPDP